MQTIISNKNLWASAKEEPRDLQIKKQKWLGQTKRKNPDTVEKQARSWKPQGQSKIEDRGRFGEEQLRPKAGKQGKAGKK